MGVKFNREYKEIVTDLAGAIGSIEDSYEAFEMAADDWSALDEAERAEYLRTLADDVFYGLGSSSKLGIGSGAIEYDPANHVLKVYSPDNVVRLIKLI
ncbi:hypothetical protein [Paenibacillus sp.]|uniref:hypothetical protein n=1 Tax=Paenibacillus sp. TaxID=58172 RepID=UPI002D4C34CC|nr:hypothetical protein [Paenibacillus sp.]HZG57012.1 hypothetical protein [Paenibacillus sp.]